MSTATPRAEPHLDRAERTASRGSVVRLALALGAGLVVTAAVTGPDPIRPLALDRVPLWAIRAGGLAIALAGLSVLLRYRGGPREGRAEPTVVSLRSAATVMALLAVLAVVTRPTVLRERPGGAAAVAPGGWIDLPDRPGSSGLPARTRGGASSLRGSALDGGADVEGLTVTAERSAREPGPFAAAASRLLPVLLVLLLVAAFFRSRRGAGDEGGEGATFTLLDPPRRRAAAEASLERSLDHLAPEMGDERARILSAYRALLSRLSEAGFPRAPHEAPHEYLQRALEPLGVRSEALHRLTGLYVLAEYGDAPITTRHLRDASEALERGLSDLRASKWAVSKRGASKRAAVPA